MDNLGNWIALGILIVILVAAIVYVVRAKKSGKKCIGCPDGACCPSKTKGNNADESSCSCCSCGCGCEQSAAGDPKNE